MTSGFTLASPELEGVEVRGMTRSAFVLRGALAAGAVYGAGFVSPFVSKALAQSEAGDLDILNFALTLEYLEAAFYEEAAGLDLGGDVKRFATQFGEDEAAHVTALTETITALGGTPTAKPEFSFPITNQKTFLTLAQTLEDTGVSAYNGAGPMIQSKEVLAAAGSIVQIEARHAAIIRLLNGAQPAPDAFDPTLTVEEVTTAVTPLIV